MRIGSLFLRLLCASVADRVFELEFWAFVPFLKIIFECV